MRKKLNKKLCMDDIYEICILTHGNNRKKAELYQLIFDEDERVATNALWVFTHFDLQNNEWLYSKHDDLIDRVLVEKNETKRRLMLSLLLRQPFEENHSVPTLSTSALPRLQPVPSPMPSAATA